MNKLVLVCLVMSGLAVAQDKPRVFVQGKGSQDVTSSGSGGGGKHWGVWGSNSTIDSHDEAMEVTKDLQKECGGVTVTLNQSAADYTIMLNRESKKNRGLLRANSQVQVANRLGDVLGTNATHTVGNASKDACQLIVADWSQHGRLQVSDTAAPASAPATTPAPAVAPAVSATAAPATGARIQTVSETQTGPANASVVIDNGANGSVGDAAKRAQQHKACLDLARDNPSIVCK